jgi:hypothetical protein
LGLVLALLCGLTLVAPAWAQSSGGDPRDKFMSGNTVTIPRDMTVSHDLYVTGGTIRIDGGVDGDLFVLGGTVDVSGPVSGDLFAAGGTVTLSGSVGRHLRAAGGNVTVSGDVKQDLLAAAGTLNVNAPAHIGGDFIFTGGQTTFDGTVDGSVLGSAQTYNNSGTVAGTQDVSLRQQAIRRAQPSAAQRLFDQVRRYLSILLAGVLLVLLLPRLTAAAETQAQRRPLPSLGIGLLVFVGFLAVALALFIGASVLAVILGVLGFGQLALTAIFGGLIGMGLLGYVFIVLVLFIAFALSGLVLGRQILQRVPEPWATGPYVALLLGIFILVILTALPIVGGLLDALAVIFGAGALALALWPVQPAATPAPA